MIAGAKYRWCAEIFLTVFICMVILFPGAGEWYARTVFPFVSDVLSWMASFIPVSGSDCFIYGSLLFLSVVLFTARRRRWRSTVGFMLEYLWCVALWFYLAWGLNYFRDTFYQRAALQPAAYDKEVFSRFLSSYTSQLNASYVSGGENDTCQVQNEIKAIYARYVSRFGLKNPQPYHTAKPMISSALMSRVGVLIGPFFNEATLNADLLPVQYPSVYAHELAHVLGTAGEGEANFYAWLVCTSSSDPYIRFSGWFSLYPYVLASAYRCLPERDFRVWLETVRPEVKSLYHSKEIYWQEKYDPWLGKIQDYLYNWYLKSNRISGGTANYSEVVNMVLVYQEMQLSRVSP